jgi:5-methylcytosine-specific restriction endonuclease McrA
MPKAIPAWKPRRMEGARPTKEVRHYHTTDWRARRHRILLRDAYRCGECKRVVSGREAHVDHLLPLEDGGTDADSNLRTMCERCHGRKTRGEQRMKGFV